MGSVTLFTTNQQWDTLQTRQDSQPQDANATTAASSQQDTVKLSAAAQAKLLHREGQSVNQIASSLATTTETVDSYLGITVDEALEKAVEQTLTA
jgi:hypothetical protein